MRLSIVVQLAGRILRLFGATFILPVLVALYYGERADVGGFLIGGVLTLVLSQVMVRATSESRADLRRIEALAVVAGTWLVSGLFPTSGSGWDRSMRSSSRCLDSRRPGTQSSATSVS